MSYSLKLVLIALLTLVLAPFVIALAPFDPQGRRAYVFARLWTGAILRISGVRLKVCGLEHLDPSQAYIFMANHQSYIDIPALVQGLAPFQLRLIAKKELVWVPVFGWALWASKHILVDRSGGKRAVTTLRRAKEKILQGLSVVIFPEGTRGRSAGVLPFKRGGFVLAAMANAPIVPVTIVGSGRVLPRGDWRIQKGEIEVAVDEPVIVERQELKNLAQVSNRVRSIIAARLNRGAEQLETNSRARELGSGEARAQG
ncbi:MAG TPA: lysophospholipid acyltransferase family protein [Candidatus Acidoferrales bacterium]|nr:lysophospholipid acyltransferase family protein [Candidatus Acidoferrales bacterium]